MITRFPGASDADFASAPDAFENENDAAPSRIIARSLDLLRASITGPALTGLCTFVIHHAVETLRRAGETEEARTILIAELGDLALAQTSGPALDRILAHESNIVRFGRKAGASTAPGASAARPELARPVSINEAGTASVRGETHG